MTTVFNEGQLINAVPTDHAVVGEMYLFIYEGEFTVHRLVRRDGNKLIMKGDFALVCEEIEMSAILGHVRGPASGVFNFLSLRHRLDSYRLTRVLARAAMKLLSCSTK